MSDKAINPTVTFFMRNPKSGFSMHKVFKPIIDFDTKRFESFDVPCHRADPISIVRNIIFVFKHRNKLGINHITGGYHYLTLGLIRCKTILTIHDLVLLDNCHNKFKQLIFKYLWFLLPIKHANIITCISNTTKKKLINTLNIHNKRIITIYNPVDPIFKFSTYTFNHNCPRILHIGTAWNKNTEKVIRALHGIPCKLVIIGELTNSIKKELNVHKTSYEAKQNLTDEELAEEYSISDIVSFPSIYEGFGMPIIEAQATGRPVLTSNIDPMKEIANKCACLVNPNDTESIRKGFIRLINDNDYRNELIIKGKENSKRFSVGEIVRQYETVYEELSN